MNLQEVRERLIGKIASYNPSNPSAVEAFFSRIVVQAAADGFIMLTADNSFIKKWIETHYMADITKAMQEIYGGNWIVQIEVDETQPQASEQSTAQRDSSNQNESKPTASTARTESPEAVGATNDAIVEATQGEGDNEKAATRPQVVQNDSKEENEAPVRTQNEGAKSKVTQRPTKASGENRLTFDNFVIGASNQMAYSMAVEVADKPGNSALNPLFIYGRSGVGKTHLLCAISDYLNDQYPHLKVRYIDAMEMVNEYSNAAITKSFRSFEESFRELDVLLIDDIQALQGKQQTLDTLFRIFNELIPKGKQFVFSADRAPKNIDLDERYVSRFNSGATIDVRPPDAETKRNIAKSFLMECQQEESFPIEVSDDVLDYIAENSSSNVRELKSAVTNVVFALKFDPEHKVTKQQVKQMLANHFAGDTSNKVTADDIKNAICSFYEVDEADLVGPGRSKKIKMPRSVAIYLCREMLDCTFAAIGNEFNRTHSTIMHSYEVISGQVKEDRNLREEIEAIREKLRVQ